MPLSQLHFTNPLWLLALLIIPFVWTLFFLYYEKRQPLHQLEKFIDKHLIPYLLIQGEQGKEKPWVHLLFWSLVLCCLSLGLAGPRSNFREVPTFKEDLNLAILLDLSESMNGKDISPSRLGRAKQKIADLLNNSQGVKIGLIAFAADPHMIVPMTEDKETIKHLLPSLDTDIVYVQGSQLTKALEMADTMLKSEKNKAIVVISDGGFEDGSALQTAKKLQKKGIVLHTIGVGSLEGTPIKDHKGVLLKKNGSPIISKLEKERLSEINQIGNGRYFDADHSEEITLIFDDLKKQSALQEKTGKLEYIWEEKFYLFLLPIIPFFLLWYRRGYIFLLFILPNYSEASFTDYFYNKEQKGRQAYDREDYKGASETFEDPYRKGVAYYKMGDYKNAEEMFAKSTREEITPSATYNLGNALAKQNKLTDAIKAYENVLSKSPDHQAAKENLELVKKMLEQQKQDSQKKDPENSSSNEEQKEGEQDSSNEDKKEGEQNSSQGDENNSSNEEQKETQQNPSNEEQKDFKQNSRSEEDLDADLWLNQIKNDPKSLLKNKFYLESKKNGSKEDINPW